MTSCPFYMMYGVFHSSNWYVNYSILFLFALFLTCLSNAGLLEVIVALSMLIYQQMVQKLVVLLAVKKLLEVAERQEVILGSSI